MSLSTYYLEYGRHIGQLRRRRRRAYAPTSNTASDNNHEKINSCVSFPFRYEYGAPLGGPSGRRSSAISKDVLIVTSLEKRSLCCRRGTQARKNVARLPLIFIALVNFDPAFRWVKML